MVTIGEVIHLKCIGRIDAGLKMGGLRWCRAEVAVLGSLAVWQEEPTKRLARNAYYFDDVAKT